MSDSENEKDAKVVDEKGMTKTKIEDNNKKKVNKSKNSSKNSYIEIISSSISDLELGLIS